MVECIEKWGKDGGLPEATLSDNGGEFISCAFKVLHKKRGMVISPYKPSTQGEIENWNKFLKRRLHMLLRQQRIHENTLTLEILNDLLSKVNCAIDHEVHSTTNMVPFELFHARTDNAFYAVPGIGNPDPINTEIQWPPNLSLSTEPPLTLSSNQRCFQVCWPKQRPI